ncbi:hypothetical protein GCM10020229_54900 [Kitasatospora albolonga]
MGPPGGEARRTAQVLGQAVKERMPERTLLGIVARTAYWIEWWNRRSDRVRQ